MLQTFMPGIGKYARLYSLVSALPWADSERSVFNGALPAVSNGDIAAVTTTSPGAFEVDLTSTGVIVCDTGGVTDRQSFQCDVYDLSLRQWYGTTIEWINNKIPVYDESLSAVIQVRTGEAISPVQFGSTMSDGDGDALTYSLVGGNLPPGLTIDSVTGLISGTPT